MPLILATRWFGSFLIERKRVVRSRLFPKEPEAIAERLLLIQRGRVLKEEEELARGKRVEVTETRLAKLGRLSSADLSFLKADDYGYPPLLLRKAISIAGSRKLKESVDASTHLIEAIHALDEMRSAINGLQNRVRSWYGLYFPELADRVSASEFLRFTSEGRGREELMQQLNISDTIGSGFSDKEMQTVASVSAALIALLEAERRTSEFIETTASSSIPSLSALAGPVLSARLIAAAGGLERLARMPAGTVQLLGAEKALFRHLRQGKKPPKHGIIFQHPQVQSSPPEKRGSAARHLAARISIAARIDCFGSGKGASEAGAADA